MADAAAAHEQLFVRRGLPADFIAQLRTGIAGLGTSTGNRNRLLGRKQGATSVLADADSELRDILSTLDIVLKDQLKKNPPPASR